MKRIPFPRKRWALAAGAVSLAVVGTEAAITYAAIPDTSGAIHGCYTTSAGLLPGTIGTPQGTLRVIDPSTGATCASGEAPLTWNQTGPQGPPGPSGTATINHAEATQYGKSLTFDKTEVATLSLAPGTYQLVASAYAHAIGTATWAQDTWCGLGVNGGTNDIGEQSVHASYSDSAGFATESGTISLNRIADVPALPGSATTPVSVYCYVVNEGAAGAPPSTTSLSVHHVTLDAVQVG